MVPFVDNYVLYFDIQYCRLNAQDSFMEKCLASFPKVCKKYLKTRVSRTVSDYSFHGFKFHQFTFKLQKLAGETTDALLCNLCKLLSIQTLSRHAVNFSLGLPRTGALLMLIFSLVRAITQ